MSRRESKDSESTRHRPRFGRDPSPKRSRRKGKQESEKLNGNSNLREPPSVLDSKRESGAVNKESNKKIDASQEGIRRSSGPTGTPRSRSSLQHDERGSTGKNGRSFGRSSTSERGWWRDSKDLKNDRSVEKASTYKNSRNWREEKFQGKGEKENGSVWHHDGFSEMEGNEPPLATKRPAFREKKVTEESQNAEKGAEAETKKLRDSHFLEDGRERKEERGYGACFNDRADREGGVRESQRDGGYPVRERNSGGGGGSYRGRDRFIGRQGYHSSGRRVEKWKHDLYAEANKSPTSKNEEDQIAKVEALLAS